MLIYKNISLYLSFPYETKNNKKIKDDFTETITEIINSLYKHVDEKFNVNINLALEEFSTYSMDMINYKLQSSDLAIIDISEINAKSIYEIGYLTGQGIPIIVVSSNKEFLNKVNFINDSIFTYYYVQDLILNKEFQNNLYNVVKKIIIDFTYSKKMIYDIWFPKNTKQIHLVVSMESVKPRDANLESPNYSLMDSIGDKDTVIEVVRFLAKHYPETEIIIHPSEDFASQNLKNNLVIIGGPGGSNPGDGNIVCRKIMRKINTKISYSDDCESMIYEKNSFNALYDENLMESDYGYFATLQNPFHSEYRAILLHGIHTLGVVGAAQAFSDNKDSQYNYQTLLIKFDKFPISFESYFEVDVFKGSAICPRISIENIHEIISNYPEIKEVKNLITMKNINSSTENQLISEYLKNFCFELDKNLPSFKNDSPKFFEKFMKYKVELENFLSIINNKTIDTDELIRIKQRFDSIKFEWSNINE